MHTAEDPEIHQTRAVNQAKQKDRPKENQECPMKVIQTTSRVRLRLCVCLCSFARTTLPLLLVCCLIPTFFAEILFHRSGGPGPLSLSPGLAASAWCPHHCKRASVSGREPKPTPRRHWGHRSQGNYNNGTSEKVSRGSCRQDPRRGLSSMTLVLSILIFHMW